MTHASELFHPRSKGAGIYIINFQIHWSRDVLWALTQCFQHATFPGEGTGVGKDKSFSSSGSYNQAEHIEMFE